jgi:hypothetical protein
LKQGSPEAVFPAPASNTPGDPFISPPSLVSGAILSLYFKKYNVIRIILKLN